MRYIELDNFLKEHNMLQSIKEEAGIYAITVNNYIVYVGKSENLMRRAREHIYQTMNSPIIKDVERKYLILLGAYYGGGKLDVVTLEKYEDYTYNLSELEGKYIRQCMPPLNIIVPSGQKQDIQQIDVFNLLDKCSTYIDADGTIQYTNNQQTNN